MQHISFVKLLTTLHSFIKKLDVLKFYRELTMKKQDFLTHTLRQTYLKKTKILTKKSSTTQKTKSFPK